MACRLATWPTRRSPLFVNATTEGVVRPPSSFGITFASPPSITATQEFVVPKSIPIIFAIPSPHSGPQPLNIFSRAQESHLESLIVNYSDALHPQSDSPTPKKSPKYPNR